MSSRHVRLSLSDFEADPAELRTEVTVPDVFIKRKGESSELTGRSVRKSSFWVCYGFQGGVPWDEAFEGLVEGFGGLHGLARLLARVGARDQHIHFQTPVRGSLLQENNYLTSAALDIMQGLNLWVGFDFSDFDPTDPTHLDQRA